jgi:PTS system cellobiose-specific IIB component
MGKKITIAVLCYTGASSSYFVEALKEEAIKRQLDLAIESYTVSPFPTDFSKYDLIMVAPQVKHCMKQVQEIVGNRKIPIYALDMKTFGLRESEKAIDQMLRLIDYK